MPLRIIPIFTNVKYPSRLKLNLYVIADDQEKGYMAWGRIGFSLPGSLRATGRSRICKVY